MKRMLCLILSLIMMIPCAAAETSAMQACTSITQNYTFSIPEGYFHLDAERAAQVAEGMTVDEVVQEFGLAREFAEELLMEESAAFYFNQDVCFAPTYPGAIMFSLMRGYAVADWESYSTELAQSTAQTYINLGADESECIDLGKLDIPGSEIEWYGFTAPLDGLPCHHFYGNYGADLMLVTFNQIPEADVWPVLESLDMSNEPVAQGVSMENWLSQAYTVPGFDLKNGERFESLHGNYAFTLPAGSTQYSLQEIVNSFGGNTATLRIREVDAYGIMSSTDLHIETACTPLTGVFRSDMEADPEGMVQKYTETYLESGYTEDMLAAAYEEIGGRPFVSVHISNGVYDTSDYYTCSATGDEFCFTFYRTDKAQEYMILETLQLNEPTYVTKDTTSLSSLAQSYRKNGTQPSDNADNKTFTSHFGKYTIELPAGTQHYTAEELADEFGVSESYLNLFKADFYRIYNKSFYDLNTSISNWSGITSDMLIRQPEAVIDYVIEATLPYVRSEEDIECERINVGNRTFVRAHYFSTASYGSSSDYYTYDGQTEYMFSFYDTTFEEEYAILSTLRLTESESAPATGSSMGDRAREKLNGGDASSRSGIRDRINVPSDAGKKAEVDMSQATTFTSQFGRYSIDLPAGAVQYTHTETAEYLDVAESLIRATKTEYYSAFSADSYDLNVSFTTTPYYASDMIHNEEAVLEHLILDMVIRTGEHDPVLEMIDIGERRFARVEYDPGMFSSKHLYYATYDEYGYEYIFDFEGVDSSIAEAVLATVQFYPPTDDGEESLSDRARSKLNGSSGSGRESARDRFTGKATAVKQTETFTSNFGRYTIDLPEGTQHLSIEETADMFDYSVSDIKLLNYDCYSAFDTNYFDFESFAMPFSFFSAQDVIDDPQSIFDHHTKQYLSAETVYSANDIQWSVESIGKHTFLLAKYESSYDTSNVQDYYLYDDNKVEYSFTFYDVNPSDARAALASLQLLETENSTRSLSGKVRSADNSSRSAADTARERMQGNGQNTASAAVYTSERGYSLQLPNGLKRWSAEDEAAFSVDSRAAAELNGDDMAYYDTYHARLDAIDLYSTWLGNRIMYVEVMNDPFGTRAELLADSDVFVDETVNMLNHQKIDLNDVERGFITVGDNHFYSYQFDSHGYLYIEFQTVNEAGVQFNICFANFTMEDAMKIIETFAFTD